MNTQQTLEAQLTVLRTDLTIATKHIHALELAIRHVMEERDHLRFQCVLLHDDTLRLLLEHENEERVLREAVETLRHDLATSLDEQIRLLAQRRRLAKHLQGLMVLVRPSMATAKPAARTETIVTDCAPEEEHERPLMLIERIIAWVRSFRPTQAA